MTAIPWFAPRFDNGEAQALAAVIESGYINDGPRCRAFERRMAELLGVEHAVAVTSGTAAITLALFATGFEPGDEAIVPDFTFIATANAVTLAGGAVRFVDIDPSRLVIDVEAVEAAITSRTRAVIAVDVNGRACRYDALEAMCRRRGLILVCDTAEGLGSTFAGRALGTFGDAGCFSFSPNKFVAMGQGGLVTTRDPAIADRLRELKDQGRAMQGTGGDDRHPRIGYNFKLTDLQAAVGLCQLEALDRRLTLARARDDWYRERLSDLPGVRFPATDRAQEVCLWTDVLIDQVEDVAAALAAAGIGCRRFWHPLHSQEAYSRDPAARARGRFPHSEQASDRGIWLPSNFQVDEEVVDQVCHTIRAALK